MATASRWKLCWVILFVFLANGADLVSTYLACPDLSAEWNALHRVFGLGWAGLVGAKLFGGVLAIMGYAYYLRHRDSCYPRCGATRKRFCRYLSFGQPASWVEVQNGTPFAPHLGVNMGYFWTGMHLLIFWVALDNMLLYLYGWSMPIRQVTEFGYHMAQSLVIAAVVAIRFYYGNYARYQRAGSKTVSAASQGVGAMRFPVVTVA